MFLGWRSRSARLRSRVQSAAVRPTVIIICIIGIVTVGRIAVAVVVDTIIVGAAAEVVRVLATTI